jgi:aryl-alcohol dehydrogenase-like predicted oxidoreductase
MDYGRLGTTGLNVSRICLARMTYGSPKWRDWALDHTAAKPFIARAWKAGINLFDTADALKAVNLKFSEGELKAPAEPYQPHPVLGHS